MPDILIFDLDGTLIDSAGAILATFAEILARRGITPAIELESSLIGPPLKQTLSCLVASNDEGLLAELIADFRKIYDDETCRQSPSFPGIDDCLRRLYEQGTALHLATNKRRTPTLHILDHHCWQTLFRSVYTLNTTAPRCLVKGDMLALQLSEQAIDPARAVYIGDTQADAAAAGYAGLPFWLARWGYDVPSAIPSQWRVLNTPHDLLNR